MGLALFSKYVLLTHWIIFQSDDLVRLEVSVEV